jgi:hypothetical protein
MDKYHYKRQTTIKPLTLELVKLNNADFNIFCFAASLIKNYDQLNFQEPGYHVLNNKHS